MTDNRTETPVRRLAGMLKSTLLFMLMLVVVFAVIEGISSTVLFGYDFLSSIRQAALPEGIFQEPDDLLGWRTIPNSDMPDLFGAGQALRANEQGFRNAQNFSADRPANRVRAVCSGYSFTFGYGVSNEYTWCSRFAADRSDVESANLGQPGYGVGQAYLRYCRDTYELAHDIHLFAVIPDDFRRMRLNRFVGTNKPYFTVRDGVVSLQNVPVPESSRLTVWWTLNQGVITELRSAQFVNKLIARLSGSGRSKPGLGMLESRDLAWSILEQVHKMTVARSAKLVLVYLPEQTMPMSLGEDWRRLIEAFAAQHEETFVDVYSHVHRLPVEQRNALFSPAWGHLSKAGNQLVSDLIWDTLGKDWQPAGSLHLAAKHAYSSPCPASGVK